MIICVIVKPSPLCLYLLDMFALLDKIEIKVMLWHFDNQFDDLISGPESNC